MSALPSVSGVALSAAPAPAPAKPRARGFLHIVRHGAGPASVYVLTYHRLETRTPPGNVILPALSAVEGSEAKDLSSFNGHRDRRDSLGSERTAAVIPLATNASHGNEAQNPAPSRDLCTTNRSSVDHALTEPEARPKPALAEGAQALIDLLERLGVDFRRAEVRGALEDIFRLGSANIPDLWLSDEDLLAKGLVVAGL
jgi:hypothetical protein